MLILLFTQYILPFLAFFGLCAVIALRIHWRGGPAALAVVFFVVLFAPSLLYALIADNSSGALFAVSLVAALAAVGVLWWIFYKNKR
jgi:hypothetical protein